MESTAWSSRLGHDPKTLGIDSEHEALFVRGIIISLEYSIIEALSESNLQVLVVNGIHAGVSGETSLGTTRLRKTITMHTRELK
jgi:hypothetical protein